MATGLALFTGAAAQATNEGLLEWARQSEAEKARKAQEAIQQRQLDIQQAQLDWDKQRLEIQNQYNLGVLDLEARERFGLKTLELMQAATDPERRRALWQALADTGNSYTGLAEGLLTDSFISDPTQAMAYLNGLANAQPGTGADKTYTGVVARAAARFMGLQGQAAEDYVQTYLDLVDELNSGKETMDAAAFENARLQNADLAQSIDTSAAQAASLRQQTSERDERLSWDRELQPEVYRAAVANADILETDAAIKAIQADFLPDQMMANNRLIWEQVKDAENRNELFEATFDDQVNQIHANAQISVEEARHLLATATIRDALAQGELDRVRATVELLNSQVANTDASTAYLGVQTEGVRIANESARLGSVTALVESGNVGLLRELAPGLLEGLVAPDAISGLVDELGTIASQRLDNELKTSEANTRIAMAQADYEEQTLTDRVATAAAQRRGAEAGATVAEFQAQYYEADREFDQWAKTEQLAIQREQMLAYTASLQRPTSPTGVDPRDRYEALKMVKDSTNWTTERIQTERDELAAMQADLAVLMTAVANNTAVDIPTLTEKWGITASTVEAAVAALQTQVTNKEKGIVNGLAAIIDGGLAWGFEFTPTDLGLASDDPLFYDALGRYPWAQARAEGVAAELESVAADVQSELAAAARASGADGFVLAGGAKALYDRLEERHGADALAAIGIERPADLLDDFQSISTEYQQHSGSLEALGTQFGVDVGTRNGRDQLQSALSSLDYSMGQLEAQIREAAGTNLNPVQLGALKQQVTSLLGAYFAGIDLEQAAPNLIDPYTGALNLQAAVQYLQMARGGITGDIETIQWMNGHGSYVDRPAPPATQGSF